MFFLFLQTLAFDEQEETVGQWVGVGHGQGAGGAGQLVGFGIELEGARMGKAYRRGGLLSNPIWHSKRTKFHVVYVFKDNPVILFLYNAINA